MLMALRILLENNFGQKLSFPSIREAATHINTHDATIRRAYKKGLTIRDKSCVIWTVSNIEAPDISKSKTRGC